MTTKKTPIKSGRLREGEWHNLRQRRQCQWLPTGNSLLPAVLPCVCCSKVTCSGPCFFHQQVLRGFATILVLQRRNSRLLRDEESKLGSPRRMVSKLKEGLYWSLQNSQGFGQVLLLHRGRWCRPSRPRVPMGSLFHEPVEQMGLCFLAIVFCKTGDLCVRVCRGGNHPTYLQILMTALLRAGLIPLPIWWRKTNSKGRLFCPHTGLYSSCGKAEGSGWVWKRPLICFFFPPLLSKGNPLLRWQPGSSLGEKSPWDFLTVFFKSPGNFRNLKT